MQGTAKCNMSRKSVGKKINTYVRKIARLCLTCEDARRRGCARGRGCARVCDSKGKRENMGRGEGKGGNYVKIPKPICVFHQNVSIFTSGSKIYCFATMGQQKQRIKQFKYFLAGLMDSASICELEGRKAAKGNKMHT
jgi:hypothetical protein